MQKLVFWIPSFSICSSNLIYAMKEKLLSCLTYAFVFRYLPFLLDESILVSQLGIKLSAHVSLPLCDGKFLVPHCLCARLHGRHCCRSQVHGKQKTLRHEEDFGRMEFGVGRLFLFWIDPGYPATDSQL